MIPLVVSVDCTDRIVTNEYLIFYIKVDWGFSQVSYFKVSFNIMHLVSVGWRHVPRPVTIKSIIYNKLKPIPQYFVNELFKKLGKQKSVLSQLVKGQSLKVGDSHRFYITNSNQHKIKELLSSMNVDSVPLKTKLMKGEFEICNVP